MKVHTDEGDWEVRKPTGREIFMLQQIDPEKIDSEESYLGIKKILDKVIIQGPAGFKRDGKFDIDSLPADTFLTLFFEACSSTLEVLNRQSLT